MRETSCLYHLFRCFFNSRELFRYPLQFSPNIYFVIAHTTTTTTTINETRIMVKNYEKLAGVFHIILVFSTLESYSVTSHLITLIPTLIVGLSTPTQSTDQLTHH